MKVRRHVDIGWLVLGFLCRGRRFDRQKYGVLGNVIDRESLGALENGSAAAGRKKYNLPEGKPKTLMGKRPMG